MTVMTSLSGMVSMVRYAYSSFSACGNSTSSGVTVADLDEKNVRPNMGPMQFRGVWYPAANIGFGAPRGGEYKPMDDK